MYGVWRILQILISFHLEDSLFTTWSTSLMEVLVVQLVLLLFLIMKLLLEVLVVAIKEFGLHLLLPSFYCIFSEDNATFIDCDFFDDLPLHWP